MTNAQPSTAANADASQKILANDIHAKWDKISEQEASGMKQTSDLISHVQSKYSMNVDQAQKDVESWVNGRSFQ